MIWLDLRVLDTCERRVSGSNCAALYFRAVWPGRRSGAGRMTRMVVPCPGRLSNSSVALSNSESRLTIERPIPSPEGGSVGIGPSVRECGLDALRPRPRDRRSRSLRSPVRARPGLERRVIRSAVGRGRYRRCEDPALGVVGLAFVPGDGDAAPLGVVDRVDQQILSDAVELDRIGLDDERRRPFGLEVEPVGRRTGVERDA